MDSVDVGGGRGQEKLERKHRRGIWKRQDGKWIWPDYIIYISKILNKKYLKTYTHRVKERVKYYLNKYVRK